MNKPPVILAVLSADAVRTPALARAVELARRTGGTLHLYSMVVDRPLDAAAMRPNTVLECNARRELLEEQLLCMREVAVDCRATVFSVHYEVAWAGVPHEALLAKALDIGADYVIKDIHRPSLLSRILFTPLDWTLVRMLPCPLMLVRSDSPPLPKKIFVAVDVLAKNAERLNDCLMLVADTLAQQTGAGLDLVSVAPTMPLGPQPGARLVEPWDPLLTRHEDEFSRMAARYAVPPERRHRLVGVPGDSIARLADAQGFDLAVVGNAYHNALERMLLGSTAEVLLQELKCDLLVVKRDDFLDTLGRHVDLDRVMREARANQHSHRSRELA